MAENLVFPQGILFIGGQWNSVVSEIIGFDQQEMDRLHTHVNEILSDAEANLTPFDHVREQTTMLFKNVLKEKSGIIRNARSISQMLLSAHWNQSDHLLSWLLLALSDIVGHNVFREALSTDQQIIWDVLNPDTLSATNKVLASEVIEHVARATRFFSVTLRDCKSFTDRLSLRRTSINLSRLASCLAVNCIANEQSIHFYSAFQFLAILEATNFDNYHNCVTFFTSTIFDSLRSLCLLLSSENDDRKTVADCKTQTKSSLDPDCLLHRILHELRSLRQLCDAVPQLVGPSSADPEPRDSLSVLVFLLFDRLLALVLVQAGVTSDNYPSVWRALYQDSCKSVEGWARFFLAPKIIYD